MKPMHLYSAFAAPILVLGTLTALPLSALAEVKSLTSSELTETFIKDSTIIVTPKQQKATRQQTMTSLTISPYDLSETEIEDVKHSDRHLKNATTAVSLSDELLRDSAVKDAVALATNPLEIPSYEEINPNIPIAEILGDSRFAVPEGDQWARMYAGNQLGISLNGDKFTFSIGAPEGVGNINIPEPVHGDGIDIVPRAGGGLDVTLTVPRQE